MNLRNLNILEMVTVLGRCGGIVFSRNHPWTATVISAFILSANLVAGCLHPVFNLVSIKDLGKTLVPVSCFLMCFSCLILSVIHRDNYIKLVNEALSEFKSEFPVASKESKWNLFLVNCLVFGFALLEILAAGLYVGEAFLQDGHALLYPAWLPFSTDTTELYLLAFVFQLSNVLCAFITLLVTPLFFCNLMEQTCMHYDNLANKIREKLEQAEKELSQTGSNAERVTKALHEFLKECVQTHRSLRSRIRVIDDTFSTFFLFGLIGYIPTVSGSILEFVSYGSDENAVRILKFGAVVTGGLFMLFIPCHCGSRIVDAQMKIPGAVFDCPWNRFPDSVQRTLSIIGTVGRVPVYVTGGRIMNIDLIGYGQVTGLVYSIFTLLNHFSNNSDTLQN